MREFSELLYQLGEWLSQNWIVLALALVTLAAGLVWIARELLRWFLGFGGMTKEIGNLRRELAEIREKVSFKEPAPVRPTRPFDSLTAFEADRAGRRPEL